MVRTRMTGSENDLRRSLQVGTLHCTGQSDSRNAYSVADDPSSRGPVNPRINLYLAEASNSGCLKFWIAFRIPQILNGIPDASNSRWNSGCMQFWLAFRMPGILDGKMDAWNSGPSGCLEFFGWHSGCLKFRTEYRMYVILVDLPDA